MSRKAIPIAERLWARVTKQSGDDGCWIFNGGNVKGYGMIREPGKSGRHRRAHRVAYELTYGPITDGLLVCHRCDNPPCVNPRHLFLGTATDNQRDASAKGRTAKGDRNGSRLHPDTRARGERQHLAKLTSEQVVDIRRLAGEVSQRELARRFGVTRQAIKAVVRRDTWRHVP